MKRRKTKNTDEVMKARKRMLEHRGIPTGRSLSSVEARQRMIERHAKPNNK